MPTAPRPLRAVALVLAALASFLGTARLVRSAVPWPEDYGVRVKFEYFAAHRHEFDAVFVGSSRVYRSIVPRVMERVLARAGVELRAFNLGNPGMDAYETDFLVREVLALEPARLAWVFVEVGDWSPTFKDRNVLSERVVHWHTGAELVNALESLWTFDAPAEKRWRLARTHLRLWARRLASFGRGLEALDALARTEAPPSADYLVEGGGWRAPEDDPREAVQRRREAFLADRERARRPAGPARPDGPPGPPEPPEPPVDGGRAKPAPLFNTAAIRRQARAVRASGCEPVFFVPPGTRPSPELPALFEEAGLAPLFAFNQPQRYPQLYRADFYFDASHLNREGAEEFSRVFARLLAPRLR